jgi:uncharacterized protein YkwD
VATLWLSVAFAGARTGAGRACANPGRPPAKMTMHALRSSVLCLVNRLRVRHDLPPLHFNHDLRASATNHSRDMVANHYFAHDGSHGSTMTQRVTRSGYLARSSGYVIGENIGGGAGRRFGSPIAVVHAWMHSAPHRENMLSSRFRDFGVGVVRGFPSGGGHGAATYTLDLGARR